MNRTEIERLRDFLAVIAVIARGKGHTARCSDQSDVTTTVLVATQFHVFIIGEAVKALPADPVAQHPEVPWKDIAPMRDLISHDHDKVDAQIVRATVGRPLGVRRDTRRAVPLAEADASRSAREGGRGRRRCLSSGAGVAGVCPRPGAGAASGWPLHPIAARLRRWHGPEHVRLFG